MTLVVSNGQREGPVRIGLKDNLQFSDGTGMFDVLWGGFEFSQGSIPVHRRVLMEVHTLRPDWVFSGDRLGEMLFEASLPGMMRKVLPPSHPTHPDKSMLTRLPITEDGLRGTLWSGIAFMKEFLTGKGPLEIDPFKMPELEFEELIENTQAGFRLSKAKLIAILTSSMLHRDRYFISMPEGRPRRDSTKETVRRDPWASHVIDFGLNKHPTGLAVFDEMFAEVAGYLEGVLAAPDTNPKLVALFEEVAKIYEAKHPASERIL